MWVWGWSNLVVDWVCWLDILLPLILFKAIYAYVAIFWRPSFWIRGSMLFLISCHMLACLSFGTKWRCDIWSMIFNRSGVWFTYDTKLESKVITSVYTVINECVLAMKTLPKEVVVDIIIMGCWNLWMLEWTNLRWSSTFGKHMASSC